VASIDKLPALKAAVLREPDMSFTLDLSTSTIGPDSAVQRIWIHALITLLYMYDERLKAQVEKEARG
jgi:hypothetical protein